jgi:hypothetical protein
VAALAANTMVPMRSRSRMPFSAIRRSVRIRSSAPGTRSMDRLRSSATITVSLSSGLPTSSPATAMPASSVASIPNPSIRDRRTLD